MNEGDPKTVLEVKNLGLSYRLRDGLFRSKLYWALDDISFSLNSGDAIGIIGRNGVGKSTLLQVIAGIMVPDRGEVIRNVPHISLLSLQAGFNPSLNGRRNATLNGMLLGMRRHEIDSKIEEIKDFSELGDFFEEPISTYSTGMRSRLGFSIALQLDPDIYLLDEVMSVGDESFRVKSTAALQKKIAAGKSLVFVSHTANAVLRMCNRAIWIEHGRIEMQGKVGLVVNSYMKAAQEHEDEEDSDDATN